MASKTKAPVLESESIDKVDPAQYPEQMKNLILADWFREDYVPRNLDGWGTDLEMLRYAHSNLDNVLIYGPTGTGKTSAVMAYAAEHGWPFYSVTSGMAERRQLFGGFVPDEERGGGALTWADGPVTMLFRYGGVLLINEINFMLPKVGNTLFSGLDKRRTISLVDHKGEVIVGHKNLLVVADFNPDYEGTRPLNAALRNRFAIQEAYDYDREVERQIVSADSLLDLAARLRQAHNDGTIETPCATNMLLEFERLTEDKGLDVAIRNFLNSFNLDEQEPVKNVIGLVRPQLEGDYYPTSTSGKASTVDAESLDDDFDFDLDDE